VKVRTAVLMPTLAALLLSACAPALQWPMTIESARFPEVVIECRGEPPLTQEQCLAWAESMLAPPLPEQLDKQGIGRLVLTNRPGNSRCAADFYRAGGGLLMSASAVCPSS
jgi:hypothetical protein